MKTHLRNGLLTTALLAANPAFAQSTAQLKQENAQLRAELQALQSQCALPSSSPGASWKGQTLDARIDAIRIGMNRGRITVTTAITLQNTGPTPLILNYKWNSAVFVDSNGYQYNGDYTTNGIRGLGIAKYSTADSNSAISPGESRTITFTRERYPKNGQTVGNAFDINATFVQLEDLGEGRIRQVRDFPVAFTHVPASGRSPTSTIGNPASGVVDHAVDSLLKRLTK